MPNIQEKVFDGSGQDLLKCVKQSSQGKEGTSFPVLLDGHLDPGGAPLLWLFQLHDGEGLTPESSPSCSG